MIIIFNFVGLLSFVYTFFKRLWLNLFLTKFFQKQKSQAEGMGDKDHRVLGPPQEYGS